MDSLKIGELVMWHFTDRDFAIGMIVAYRQYSLLLDSATYDIVWICHSDNPQNILMSDRESELPHSTIKTLRDNYLEWRKSFN